LFKAFHAYLIATFKQTPILEPQIGHSGVQLAKVLKSLEYSSGLNFKVKNELRKKAHPRAKKTVFSSFV
jgi:hypothetical protein